VNLPKNITGAKTFGSHVLKNLGLDEKNYSVKLNETTAFAEQYNKQKEKILDKKLNDQDKKTLIDMLQKTIVPKG
jgi:hypothetical protein